jgi:hypothetical protein
MKINLWKSVMVAEYAVELMAVTLSIWEFWVQISARRSVI